MAVVRNQVCTVMMCMSGGLKRSTRVLRMEM